MSPTKKQLEEAQHLGIENPERFNRDKLSEMIAAAKARLAAYRSFCRKCREVGLKVPHGIKLDDLSELYSKYMKERLESQGIREGVFVHIPEGVTTRHGRARVGKFSVGSDHLLKVTLYFDGRRGFVYDARLLLEATLAK